jgi:hypothetical protein
VAAVAIAAEEFPRRMEIAVVEVHRAERSSLVVRVGEGACPWCAFAPMRAEAGQRGYCPRCAGPVLALLGPGRRDGVN